MTMLTPLTPMTHQEIAAVCRLFGWPVPTPDTDPLAEIPQMLPAELDKVSHAKIWEQMSPAEILEHMLRETLTLFQILVLEQSGIRLRHGDDYWSAGEGMAYVIEALSEDCSRYGDLRYRAQSEALAADPTAFDTRDDDVPF
jgi:hypothetical protein